MPRHEESSSNSAAIRLVSTARLVGVNAAIFFVLLFLAEGISSTILYSTAVLDRVRSGPLAEQRHTQFDSQLGWSHIPAVVVSDMYGTGRGLTINKQGFRNTREFSTDVPTGRTRLICSGDSYTLGYGVGDDDTWCHQLELIDPRLETINMGQAGYGLDQSYLWYRRDGESFDHDVHVFAYITDDFERMRFPYSSGAPKPLLQVRDGVPEPVNTPLSERTFGFLVSLRCCAPPIAAYRPTVPSRPLGACRRRFTRPARRAGSSSSTSFGSSAGSAYS